MAKKVASCNERIIELLEIKNLTQLEFCETVGISDSALSKYIHNKCVPRKQNLDAICEAFDISMDWLMGYDVPMKTSEGVCKKVCRPCDRICDLMKVKNLTQSEFADAVNISRTNISLYARNKRVPKQSAVSQISEAFGVSPAWIMGYDVPMGIDIVAEEIKTLSDNVSPTKKQKLSNLLDVAKTLDNRALDALLVLAHSQEKYLK